ncbi:MAG TPA: DUF2953 domain-containing protein [Firmicutes bacterium]|nr:DUF2953 domain-containing protein [Bacillota bacterium]
MGRAGPVLSLGLIVPAALLILVVVYYLWPWRIFIHYLRENNNVQFKVYLILWRWKLPFKLTAPKGPGGGLNLYRLKKVVNLSRPYFKQIIWKNFLLEVDLGLGDPALTGLAAGGSWALGGALLPLLFQYFRFETEPKIKINPGFYETGLKVNWEGEIAAPLSLWLRLWSLFKTSRRS